MKFLLIPIFTFLLSGCTNDSSLGHLPAYNTNKTKILTLSNDHAKKSKDLKSLRDEVLPVVVQSAIIDDFYVDTSPVKTYKEDDLPSIFLEQISIKFFYNNEQELIDTLVAFILSSTGISVDFLDKEANTSGSQSGETTDEESEYMPASHATDNPNMYDAEPEQPTEHSNTATSIQFSFDGTFKELIDKVASLLGLKWTFNEERNSIMMSYLTTKTYILPFTSHSTTSSVSISSSGSVSSDEGTSGSAGYESSSEYTSNPWEGIKTNIENMLSPSGSAVITEETGVVVVTDKSISLSKISDYIAQTVELYTTQLLVDVRVVHLSNINNDSKQINWATVNNKIGSVIASSTIGPLINSPLFDLSYKKDPGSSENNIKAAIDLLSNYSESYTVDSFSAVTSNFRPVPIQISGSSVYFKEVVDESGEEGGATSTSYEPVQQQLGTTISLTPSMIQDRINLSYVFTKSDIAETVIDPKGQAFPMVGTKTFVQNVTLKNSIPMVVSAINMKSGSNSSSSPLDTGLWFLGGSESNKASKMKDIIMVTVSRMKSDTTKTGNTYYDNSMIGLDDYLKSKGK